MGIRRIFNILFYISREISILVVLILFVPGLPPYSEFTKSVKLPPTKPMSGALALNEKLNNAEIIGKGRLVGPESFSAYNNELYTGVYGGEIVKLSGKYISHIVQTGTHCRGLYDEPMCGRPLGIKFHNGVLYVADAYYGILLVNVHNGGKKVLIPPNEDIEGKTPKWFNGLAVAKNGDIYWTDSSTNFHLDNGLFEFLSDPSGRLIHYNAKNKTNTVLIDKISAANGVALSSNEDFVLVSEPVTSRILRYYLKGPKNGTYDVFVDGLPGIPDNINLIEQGDFLVPLVSPVDPDHPSLVQTFLRFPLIRKLIARCMGLSQLSFRIIHHIYPTEYSKIALYMIGRISPIYKLFDAHRATVLRISENGEIMDSLHATNKKLRSISEAYVFNKFLYLGSSEEDYVARIPLSNISWNKFGWKL